MNGEIICVGTELLLGDIVNTNAQYLSRELAAMGISVFGQSTVGDNAARLKKVLGMAVARSQIVIITGGLGPTKDDLTKETVAQAVGLPLEEDAESLRRIEAYFQRVGRPMGESNRKQALKPHGAIVFPNDRGTAPGYAISAGDQCIVLLPGPPDELKPMFENYVKPYLAQYETGTIVSHTLRVFGIGESAAAERLADLLDGANPTVAPYAKTGEVELRVTASAADRPTADELCRPVMEEIRRRLDGCIYGVDKDSLQQVVVEGLRQRGMKAATAESCTAGLLSKRLTEEPGSSSVFEMGITAYADSVKINALGVDPALIEQYGAVSAQTAAAMAGGIREISGAHVGLSITGVAGPEPSEGKPVGLVYIALADEKQVYVRRLMAGREQGEREKIRSMAASAALDLLRRWLENPDMPGAAPYAEPAAINGGRGAALAAAGILAAGEDVVLDALPGSALPPVEVRPMGHAEQIMSEIRQNLNQEEYGEEPSAEELFSSAGPEDPAAKLAAREPSAPLEENTILYVSDYEEDYHPGQKAGVEKKLPWYSRMRRYLFPCRGDSAGEVIRKIIFLVAAACLIGSGIYLGVYFYTGHQQLQSQGETRKLYDPTNNDIGADGIYKKFYPLLEQNSDTIGWMSIPNANVDNPVVKTPEDYDTLEPFYLKHAFDKSSSRYGALFVDRYTDVTFQRQSQNIVVYGHHMRDGSMFGSVKKYRQLDFYKENPTIEFDTLYRKGTYKIFSVFIVNTIPESDNGFVFEYRYSDFDNQEDFMQMVEQMQIRSIINTPVDVLPGDELLTLSTCTYEFDDARLVVVARKVREGESASVDVGAATLNPKPLYPQIWYDKKGGTRPDVTSIQQKTYSAPSITTRPASSNPSDGASQGASSSRPSTNSQSATTSRPKVSVDTPTTAPPTTAPPVTDSPVTEPDPSVTEPPVTDLPVTEPDSPTDPPVTDPPVTEPDPPVTAPPEQGGGDEPAE